MPSATGHRSSARAGAELLKRQATIVEELRRLTHALAAGGDSRSIRTAIRTREAEAARIDRELRKVGRIRHPSTLTKNVMIR
jgi:hypothetical protein